MTVMYGKSCQYKFDLLCCFQGVGLLKTTASKFSVMTMLLTLCMLIGMTAGFWYAHNWPGSYSLHNSVFQGHEPETAVTNHGANGVVAQPSLPEITISMVGDVLLAAGVEKYIQSHGSDYPWQEVRPVFAGSDFVLGNLECAVATGGEPMENKQFTFRAQPDVLAGAVRAGVDIFTLANNHVLDFGRQAMLETIANLDHYGIKHTGAGINLEQATRPVILEQNGVRLGVLSYTMIFPEGWWVAGPSNPGIASGHDMNSVIADVKALRSQVDLLVVSIHWGVQLADHPRPNEQTLAYMLVDAGADLVFGHHPHVLQGLEYYNDSLIAYSAGNFIFTTPRSMKARQGMILQVRAGHKGVLEAVVVPTLVDAGRAKVLQGEDREQVLRRLETLSAPFGTVISLEGKVTQSSSNK